MSSQIQLVEKNEGCRRHSDTWISSRHATIRCEFSMLFRQWSIAGCILHSLSEWKWESFEFQEDFFSPIDEIETFTAIYLITISFACSKLLFRRLSAGCRLHSTNYKDEAAGILYFDGDCVTTSKEQELKWQSEFQTRITFRLCVNLLKYVYFICAKPLSSLHWTATAQNV